MARTGFCCIGSSPIRWKTIWNSKSNPNETQLKLIPDETQIRLKNNPKSNQVKPRLKLNETQNQYPKSNEINLRFNSNENQIKPMFNSNETQREKPNSNPNKSKFKPHFESNPSRSVKREWKLYIFTVACSFSLLSLEVRETTVIKKMEMESGWGRGGWEEVEVNYDLHSWERGGSF